MYFTLFFNGKKKKKKAQDYLEGKIQGYMTPKMYLQFTDVGLR